MICPHCNEEIPDDSIFCSSCGKRLEPSPAEVIPSDTIVCPNCGAYNSKDSNFCSNCRTPLSQTALTNLKEQSELQLQQAIKNASHGFKSTARTTPASATTIFVNG